MLGHSFGYPVNERGEPTDQGSVRSQPCFSSPSPAANYPLPVQYDEEDIEVNFTEQQETDEEDEEAQSEEEEEQSQQE